MACYLMKPSLTAAEIEAKSNALKVLERKLEIREGGISVVIGANGAVAFRGWSDAERGGIADTCAYRALSAINSPALRRAVARAEALYGRKVNPQAIASGVHSHDGGNTFHHGH